jgi:aminoglycoside phosphotransferase
MPLLRTVNPETVTAALRESAGIAVEPETLKLERRSSRWLAALPDGRLLFIADQPESAAQLGREGRLLQTLAARVSFGLPRVEDFDPAFGLQIRVPVAGAQLSGAGRERAFAERPQGVRLARDLGEALAALHRAFTADEARALGFSDAAPTLPQADALATGMDERLTDPAVRSVFEALLRRYRETTPDPGDIALVHADIWGGNLAVDLETGALNGLFDFADAGLGDRHLDLMYLHSFGSEFTGRLFRTYETATGFAISWPRTALYHAISAFSALADTPANNGEDHMLEQRRRWVADVCNGPVARMALE